MNYSQPISTHSAVQPFTEKEDMMNISGIPYGFSTLNMTNQVVTNAMLSYFKFYYFSSHDNNFYYVSGKSILQNDVDSFGHHDHYNHGFFFQHPNDPSTVYFVTCKLLPFLLLENILNNGMDFDVKCEVLLSIYQKFNLEQSLKQKLFDLMRNVNSTAQIAPMADIQNYNDNGLPNNVNIAHQNTNESVNTYYNVTNPQQQVDFQNN
ncbi:hypothetical protein C1645_824375 [Glomus cerebriforme]|uniref:Uncharacterized protein n=1 Tax=Glomus cerebriforme TaxID=658196 RepID=A0A397T3V1_9GLOM|nr:hypothetical protein C1645_824375 [Glomus cerebriforme]